MNDTELLDKLDEVTKQGKLPGFGFEDGWRGWWLTNNIFASDQTDCYPTVREALEALLAKDST